MKVPLHRGVELEALEASILRFGVIQPVVKDQDGNTIEGQAREEIAQRLGIECPTMVRECSPEERDIVRLHLNVARRQIPRDQWQPLVDHLRGEGYADRHIANVIGIPKNQVHRYKPETSDVPNGTTLDSAPKRLVGTDGSTKPAPGNPSASERVLQLLQEAPDGLTVADLRDDALLSTYVNLNDVTASLIQRGLIAAGGKRGRGRVYVAVPKEEAPPPPEPKPKLTVEEKKVEQFITDLKDPKLRTAATERSAADREVKKAMRLIQRYDADAWAEERERNERLLVEVETLRKQGEYWEALVLDLKRVKARLSMYVREYDDMPTPSPATIAALEGLLQEFKVGVAEFEGKLWPDLKGLRSGIIDIA